MAENILSIDELKNLSKEERLSIVSNYITQGQFNEVKSFWGVNTPIKLYPFLKKLEISDEIRALLKEYKVDSSNESAAGLAQENVQTHENVSSTNSQIVNFPGTNNNQEQEHQNQNQGQQEEIQHKKRGRRKGSKSTPKVITEPKQIDSVAFHLEGVYDSSDLTEKLMRMASYVESSNSKVKTNIILEIM